ncbi:MAG: hypothetical protein K8S25_02080 [Alphaproteobacteria bacterium]|nr:hypothetical protein [Alphaproteobacteria bacterium]
MATAARIAASFLLALFASVGPFVVAVLLPWLKEVAAFYISFVLMLCLPVMIASGLAWLPVMLAARNRGFDGKLGAVTMSPLAAAAFYALYIAYQSGGHELAKPIAWGAMIFFAPMMIVFSSVFFYVDRRWGQSEGGSASARVIMAVAALLTAWVLIVLALFDKWRP